MYQVYSTLIRFDIEAVIILDMIRHNLFNLAVGGWIGIYMSNGFFLIYGLTIVLAPVSIYFGVRKEIKIIQILYLIFSLILPIFVITLLIIFWRTEGILSPLIFEWEIPLTKINITLLSIAFIIIRLTMIFFGILLMFNYGMGLKEKIYSKDGLFHDYWREYSSNANFFRTSSNEIDDSHYYEDQDEEEEEEEKNNRISEDQSFSFHENDPLIEK